MSKSYRRANPLCECCIVLGIMTDIELKGLKINDDTDLKQWFVQFKKK